MTYVVTMIDGSYFIITEEQAEKLKVAIERGAKTASDGKLFFVLHQVSGVVELQAFRRTMKHKLSVKKLRMCHRCHAIVGQAERCSCFEDTERQPDIMEIAKLENPKLTKFLQAQAERMALNPGTGGVELLPSGQPSSQRVTL